MLYAFFKEENGKCIVTTLSLIVFSLTVVSLSAAAETKKAAIDFDYKAETAKNSNVWNNTALETKQAKTNGNSANRSTTTSVSKKTGTGTSSSDGVFVPFGDSSNAANGDDGGYLKANDNIYAQDSSIVESVPSVGLSIRIGTNTKQKQTASGNRESVGQPVQKSTAVQKKTTAQKTSATRNTYQPRQTQTKTAIVVTTEGTQKSSAKKGLSGESKGAIFGWKKQSDAEKADERRKKEQQRKRVNVAEAEVEKIIAENIKLKRVPGSASVAEVTKQQRNDEPPQKSALKTDPDSCYVWSKTGKVIQFGAYSQKSSAQAALEKAENAGVKHTKIVTSQQNGKIIYKVQVNTGNTEKETQLIATKLKKAGFDLLIK